MNINYNKKTIYSEMREGKNRPKRGLIMKKDDKTGCLDDFCRFYRADCFFGTDRREIEIRPVENNSIN